MPNGLIVHLWFVDSPNSWYMKELKVSFFIDRRNFCQAG